MRRMLLGGARRVTHAIGVLLAVALLAQGAAATPDLDSATEAHTQLAAAADVEPLDSATGQVPVMLQMEEPPAAAVFAEERGKGHSKGDAGNSAKAQKQRNERAQDALVRDLEGKGNVKVLYTVQTAYDGVVVQADASQLDELAQLPGVAAVHRIPLLTPDNASTVPLIGGPIAWQSYGITGSGMRIGVIDTGIDYVHTNFGGPGTAAALAAARSAANNPASSGTTHPTGFGVVSGGAQLYPSAKVAGGFDFAGDAYTGSGGGANPRPDPNPEDCPSTLGGGHGSHTSGTAAGYGVNADGTTYSGPYDSSVPFSTMRIGPGVAPQAQIYALRVFGCSGSTALTTQAIDWATDPNGDGDPADHLDAINMSLGSASGTPDDPSAAASDNAARLGVIVVASAGNSGDTFFVSGSPGSSARTITVAASTDEVDVTDGFRINSPAASAGVYGASRSSAFNWSPSMTPVTADLYYPATNQYGCAAWTDAADKAGVTGKIVMVDWKKPGDPSFPCGSAVRANNATVAGARGILMVDTTPYLDTAISGNTFIPAMYTTRLVGDKLRSALASGGAVSITLTAEYNNLTHLVTPGWNDLISSFSSRGPQGRGNLLKPDITAPGQGVFSTDAGTGNQGKSLNGTSMSAPHMTGVMALLRQAHPDWTVEQLKALAMNTASQDLFSDFDHAGPKFGLGRTGAGRVSVTTAMADEAVAYNADGSGSVSLSFGAVEVSGVQSFDRTARVDNLGSTSATYELGYDERMAIPGVSFSFPDGPSVTVPAGGSATFHVRMTGDASKMRATHDPTVTETQASGTTPWPRQWASEAGGLVTLTPAGGTPLRLPVYAIARPASAMGTVESTLGFTSATGSTTLHLAGTGLSTGGSTGQDYTSLVSAFELQGRSPKASLGSGVSEFARDADLKEIGVTSDAKGQVAHGKTANDGTIYFALTTWHDWSTPGEVSFNVFIDTNRDGRDDYNLFATRLTDGSANANPIDVFVTAVSKLPSSSGPVQGYMNVFDSGLNTAIFDNNVVILPVSAAALGMSPGNTRFNYRVTAGSRFWGTIDTAGPFTFDYASPGIDFTGGATGVPTFSDLPSTLLPATFDQTAFATDGSLGALLLHHFNASGTRAQALPAQIVSGTEVAVTAPPMQYSDPATLTAKVTPVTAGSDPLTGIVQFAVDGVAVGSAAVDASGVATLSNVPNLRVPGGHPVTATFVSSSPYAGGSGSGILTVTKEDAVVTPSASNPDAVGVTAPGVDASKAFTLSAAIAEVADGSLGDIGKAVPVTFTLDPVAGGSAPAPCAATTSVSGGTLTATCAYSGLPADVYDVAITVGGEYYAGSGSTTVVVYDTAAGNVTGGGTIVRDGVRSNFALNAKYQKNGNAKGSFQLVDHRSTGDLTVRSSQVKTISVAGKAAVLTGKANVAGAGNYSFRLTVVDNGEPGASDTIALELTDAAGHAVATESFATTALAGGNIQVR